MFSAIVVGTDGSPDAIEAVKAAGQLASIAPFGTVHVVTAFDPLTMSELNRLDKQLPAEFHDQLTRDLIARSVITEAEAILKARGVKHTSREISGSAADAILGVVDEVGASIVVVGSRGEGAFDRLRHGSVSTKVLHESPCSVLVVKSKG